MNASDVNDLMTVTIADNPIILVVNLKTLIKFFLDTGCTYALGLYL